jgi:hypothetical protein
MNVNLLQRVKQHILEEPKRLYMRHFEIHNNGPVLRDRNGVVRDFASCDTAACIGGWGAILDNYKTASGFKYDWDYQNLFDLTEPEACRLFNPKMWPMQFKRGIFDDGSPEAARACADRIDFFIQTKGTDDERELIATS